SGARQVAKNVLLNNEITVGRKVKEAFLATRLEQVLSKQRILELYLNEIWLGYRSYGVGAAAYNYFGKSVSDLSLAQCAYLAALPKGPDNYRPIQDKAAAIRRRNMILREMAEMGWVSWPDARSAMAEDLVVQPAPVRTEYHDADYFVAEAQREAEQLKSVGGDLDEGGYYVRTTLVPRLQTAARIALMDGLETYDRAHGWRGAWGHVAIEPGWQKAALAASPPSERKKWRAAVITEVSGDLVRAEIAQDDAIGQIVPADVAWARAGKGLKVGDLVFVEPNPGGGLLLKQVPAVNGAIVAMQPDTGRVLAMVGGYSFSLSKFDRATQAYRQPGSSFKPFVYATALESGDFTPASVVLDAPLTLVGYDGKPWRPENYEHRFYGPSYFRRGLVLSLNAMTVRIAQRVGMSRIVDLAEKFGVVDHMAPVLSMALGADETTVLRMTTAYSSFVNGGRKVSPRLIALIDDRNGKTIYRADDRSCDSCNAPYSGAFGPDVSPTGEQLIDPITAYQIDTMLEGVVQHGTGYAARVLGRPIGGKTGTTNDYRSAWFMGFSPQIVVGVFVGFDDNRSLGQGQTGAQVALPIFIEFMQEALKAFPPLDFVAPPDAKFAMVGWNREAFRPGTEPRPQPSPILVSGEDLTGQGFTPAAAPAPPPPPLTISPVPKSAKPLRPPQSLDGLY
ncbi:MAG: penicillin-binding protein 1A, partial [Caulobacteraceae bacterium]